MGSRLPLFVLMAILDLGGLLQTLPTAFAAPLLSRRRLAAAGNNSSSAASGCAELTADVSSSKSEVYRVMALPAAASTAAAADAISAAALPAPVNPAPFTPTQDLSTVREASGLQRAGTGSAGAASSPQNMRVPDVVTAAPRVEATESANSLAFGTSYYPFTTRAAYSFSTATSPSPTQEYPWRATGRLNVNRTDGAFFCSASLIRPGVLVTAASCIMPYGSSNFPSSALFQPAFFDNSAPYGSWSVRVFTVPSVWVNGKDACDPNTAGKVCENDLAVLTLFPNSNGRYAGDEVGWYSYGWNGYSFSSSFYQGASAAQITSLGYAKNVDGGLGMIRTDSLAITKEFNQMQAGSAQRGGFSGAPWIVNFGWRNASPSESDATDDLGNVVVGVSSWARNATSEQVVGASRFGNNKAYLDKPNIVQLLEDACDLYSDDEELKSNICGKQ